MWFNSLQAFKRILHSPLSLMMFGECLFKVVNFFVKVIVQKRVSICILNKPKFRKVMTISDCNP